MTDPRPSADPTPPSKPSRHIPPLVWIILVLLVGWVVVMMVQRKGGDAPEGVTSPVQAQGPSVMPPAPATPEAPATPGGVANGPNDAAPEAP